MSDTNAIKWLRAQGVSFDVLEYDYERIGAEAAAEAVGRPLEMVCKTLVVRGPDRSAWAAIVPGDQRFDSRKTATAIGAKSAELMEADEAERISGYKLGGVSPFCMRRSLPTILEESLLVLERIVVNGGRRGVLVELATEDLVRLLDARAADVCS
ncbi:MAG: aminoacyl-tRNA deacylase [Phycisphaerales bacterium]|nr:aminoacyl-tRNA deacylase [Phycisphaerales bacterium]MCB9854243.1 aminoacyl-tRNA deacylase [Phycisphaerales bacterium]MCB9864749.1 aminoacyl-tRNA deacylase [Phycisphaerales bacterium]